MSLVYVGASDPIQTSTWANLPAASSVAGKIYLVSNIGSGGSLWESNGTRWVPMFSRTTLIQNNTTYSLTGTLTETTLATVSIPGNLMSANGQLSIISLWSCTNNANAKAMKIQVGSGYFANITTTATNAVHNFSMIINAGATNSQVAGNLATAGFGSSSLTPATASVDTTVDWTFDFRAQLVNVADNVSLISYTVILGE